MSHEQPAKAVAPPLAHDRAAAPFITEGYRSALACLNKAFVDGRPLAILTGEDRSGADFIVRSFLDGIDLHVAAAHISESCQDVITAGRGIVQAFGFDADNMDATDVEDVLRMFLSLQKMQDRRTIICIDVPQVHGNWVQQTLRQLIELETEGSYGLMVILAGRPGKNGWLEFQPLDATAANAALIIPLDRFTLADTRDYIRWRIESERDASIEEVFEHDAITRTHQLSEGVPDRIDHVFTKCLQIVEDEGTTPVTADIVKRSVSMLRPVPVGRPHSEELRFAAANVPQPARRRLVVRLHGKITQEQSLRQGHMLIGRDKMCDVRLANTAVSRHHAVIVNSTDGAAISDLASSNGTYVGGRRIRQCVLKDADLIGIGGFMLQFVIGDDGRPETAP